MTLRAYWYVVFIFWQYILIWFGQDQPTVLSCRPAAASTQPVLRRSGWHVTRRTPVHYEDFSDSRKLRQQVVSFSICRWRTRDLTLCLPPRFDTSRCVIVIWSTCNLIVTADTFNQKLSYSRSRVTARHAVSVETLQNIAQMFVELHLKSPINRRMTFKVIQGRWKWHESIGHMLLTISGV